MSLEIRQFTSSTPGNFLLDLTSNPSSAPLEEITQGTITTTSAFNVDFKDSYFTISEKGFQKDVVYYLEVDAIPYSVNENTNNLFRTVTLKLQNKSGSLITAEQFIDELKISLNSSIKYHISIIFKPIQNFSDFVFLVNRTSSDAAIQDTAVRQSKILTLDSIKIYKINNGLTNNNIAKIYKMGIQGTPGLLMCINGEAIRIGPSGIYEIKNGYKITFLRFIKRKSNEHFIVDYLLDVSNQSNSG